MLYITDNFPQGAEIEPIVYQALRALEANALYDRQSALTIHCLKECVRRFAGTVVTPQLIQDCWNAAYNELAKHEHQQEPQPKKVFTSLEEAWLHKLGYPATFLTPPDVAFREAHNHFKQAQTLTFPEEFKR